MDYKMDYRWIIDMTTIMDYRYDNYNHIEVYRYRGLSIVINYNDYNIQL